MKLIKNGAITTNEWLDEIDTQLVPAEIYLANPQLSNRIKIGSNIDLDELEQHISNLSLIVIESSSFTDGRGFSLAYGLRQMHGYKEKLWISGNLIPDQYAMAEQCGIDGILIDEQQLERQPIEQWQQALKGAPIPYRYQKVLKSNSTVNDSTIDFLNAEYENTESDDLLETIVTKIDFGKIALVSSFGTESAVLLHLLSKHAPHTDVLFLDTGKLFPETLAYQKQLEADFKLTNIKIFRPSERALSQYDPKGSLCQKDNSRCCEIRKVIPLQAALAGYDTWISGRKSFQNEERSSLKIFERSGSHIKINPLANWQHEELVAYIKKYNLPEHPLAAKGYASVGCAPCTTPISIGEDPRGGRWRGQNKTECGIHFNDKTAVQQSTSYHY